MDWHIGCSGFHYAEWKDLFYPAGLAKSKWFAYYTDHFDSIELNATFYRFPRADRLKKWYEISPPGFLFAVKAPRLITHFKKFNECGQLIDDFLGSISEGLADKLGPVLFQLPPGMTYTQEKMAQVVLAMRPGFINVVECRHESWWNKEVYSTFKKKDICFCGASYPGLPDNVVITSKNLYYRLHGVPRLYFSSYKKNYLRTIAGDILRSKAKKAFVYFNNTASMAAIENAGYLLNYLERIPAKKRR